MKRKFISRKELGETTNEDQGASRRKDGKQKPWLWSSWLLPSQLNPSLQSRYTLMSSQKPPPCTRLYCNEPSSDPDSYSESA